MNVVKTWLVAGLLALLCGPAFAQGEAMSAIVAPGFATTYMLPVDFSTLNVGDPKVADATATTNRTIIIHGVAPGQTNFLFFDAQGKEVVDMLVTVPGQGTPIGVVHIHAKIDNVHGYVAYQCIPRAGQPPPRPEDGNPCFRIHDDLQGEDRVPPPRVLIQNFNNPAPADNTPPKQ